MPVHDTVDKERTEAGADGDLPLDDEPHDVDPSKLPDIYKTLGGQSKEEQEQEARPRHELPLPASEVMTVDEAYEFLGISPEDRGDLEVLKARFRKLCFKYHPDKNRGREEAAARSFQAVHAAYHFLTTMNFDYKRWKRSFSVPPLQSLEEVLMLALSGEDPYNVELLMRRRGEYRPHQDFGVNLSIPWAAGTQEDASWEVANGSAYSTTQGIASKQGGVQPELGWQAQVDAANVALNGCAPASGVAGATVNAHTGAGGNTESKKSYQKKMPGQRPSTQSALALADQQWEAQRMSNELAVVEAPRVRELGLYKDHDVNYLGHYGNQAELGKNMEARPWEAVALGKTLPQRNIFQRYEPPKLRPDLHPGDAEANEVADHYNTRALEAFKKKEWQMCYDLASEAIRLKPDKVAYLGNRAAACLKLRGLRHLRQACDDCAKATQIDPGYAKGYARAAEASYGMGERHTIRKAMELYETAIQLDGDNKTYRQRHDEICLEWEANWNS